MSKDNGGPAFPITIADKSGKAPSGMTLRDYFAGQALAGLLAQSNAEMLLRYMKDADERSDGIVNKYFSEFAYSTADAMLKAREE